MENAREMRKNEGEGENFFKKLLFFEFFAVTSHRDSAESTPAHLHLPSSVTERPQYDNSQRYVVSGA